MYIYDSTYFCTDTVPVRCYAQYEIIVYSTIQDVICYGDSMGEIVIDSITGGNLPYDIQWGGIDTNNLSAGSYTVVFVDNIGCIHQEQFIINQPDQFNANPIIYPPTCYDTNDGIITINITGGSGLLSYYWLNNVSGFPDSIYNLSTDLYSLVIVDSNLCIDTIDIILESPDSLGFVFANYNNQLLCHGSVTTVDIIIDGGVGPYSILWNDGSSDIQRILGAGLYYCQVTDNNGCTKTDTLIINETDSLVLELTFNYSPCDSAGSNAFINIIGGTPPISIIWSTGDTVDTIDSLFSTNYWVIVTDSCGNSDSSGFNAIPFLLETSLYYDNITHIGSIEIDNSSTGGPFSYEWIDILGNVISVDDSSGFLCQETYFIYVTDDSSGCVEIDTLDATFYLPNGIIDISTTTVLGDSLLWGFGPYTYLWDNGVIEAYSNICPGNHWVEVTDINGCTVREDIRIEPIIISLTPSEAIIECNLENLDVEIEATVTGGTSPYTYEWTNGSTNNPLNLAVSPGDYEIKVLDNNACIADTSFIIATLSSECIPNVFTPNSDGINDFWNLEDIFLYEDSEVNIYGRFGRLIFSSIGYAVPWDGNNNGSEVPCGTYFYTIKIGHGFNPIKGTVVILR